MVSFSCENCGDVLTKGKLDKHRGHCYGATFTCIDCMVHFPGASYKSHTSCMSEAQKYQGALYKGEKKGKGQQKNQNQNQNQNNAMIPRKAYVEDDTDANKGAVAVVDVPPRAPTPPPNDTVVPPGAHHLRNQPSSLSDDSHFRQHGYSYGEGPVQPGLGRYESYASLPDQGDSQDSDNFRTPGPSRKDKEEGRSEKKRKRNHMDELDISRARQQELESSGARPSLHTGLTGGLNRLLSRPVDDLERDAGLSSPHSPTKRSKKDDRRSNGDRRRRRGSSSSEDNKRTTKVIESSTNGNGQIVQYRNPAELFLSFVTKGPESERGMSINKALKRYHREKSAATDKEKDTVDKEIWKDLRVRRNERGEIVLFI